MTESLHLRQLEAEAIYIIREVAAECENPVMLYSIGKDSSVMLHLAMKAFYPEKPPFPFMHIDTTWKFKEMIEFRDRRAKELGIEMIVHKNEEGIAQNINPQDHGAAYTDIMKTQSLKQGLDKYGFTAAFGGGRRDEEKSRAKERIFSFRNKNHAWDPKINVLKCGSSIIQKLTKAKAFAYSRFQTGLKRIFGNTFVRKISILCHYISPRNALLFIVMAIMSWSMMSACV